MPSDHKREGSPPEEKISDHMHERVVHVLKNIFQDVDEDIIKNVVLSLNGHMNPSVEALMQLTNCAELKVNGYTVSLDRKFSTDSEMARYNWDLQWYPQPAEINISNSSINNRSRECNKNPQLRFFDTSLMANTDMVRKLVNDINNGFRVLVLMRGLPGSGKTTLARKIVLLTTRKVNNHIFSTDDYFVNNNQYRYNRDKLQEAHHWNKMRVKHELTQGLSPVIVDNTNIELWEMQSYAQDGAINGYIITVLETGTLWATKPAELARKNIHNVPLDKLRSMAERYKPGLKADYLLKTLNISYTLDKMPPQQRLYPPLFQQDNILSYTPGVLPFSQNYYSNSNFHIENNAKGSSNISMDRCSVDTSGGSWNNMSKSNRLFGAKNGQSTKTGNDNIQWTQDIFHSKENAKYLNDHPKPQRNRRSGIAESIPGDGVNWKPIDTTLSDWEYIAEPSTTNCGTQNSTKNLDENLIYQDATTQFQSHPESESFKTLIPVNRDINVSYVTSKDEENLAQTYTLHKGTMTEEVVPVVQDENIHRKEQLKQLRMLFRNISKPYLCDILERCNGDINWAGEILLDVKPDSNMISYDSASNPEFDDFTDSDSSQCDAETYPLDADTGSCTQQEIQTKIQTDETSDIKEKKDKTPSEASLNLKKILEQNFTISDDYYSEHVLKLRKKNHRDKSPNSLSELSGEGLLDEIEKKLAVTEDENACALEVEENITSAIEEYQSSKRNLSESSEGDSEEDKIVSIRVGKEFVDQLGCIYGTPLCDDNLEPIIHIPVCLLDQIQALWIESVYNQIDVQKENMKAIIKEDEAFARELEAKEKEEASHGTKPEVPNLQDIMQMEMDMARYNMANSEWQKDSPDDLASRLSKKKLVELFPTLNENVLMELFHAYDYNFEATCGDLLVSTGMVSETQANGFDSTAIKIMLAEQERDLIQRSLKEKDKAIVVQSDVGPSTSQTVIPDRKARVLEYRREAVQQLNMRNMHYAKAQEYIKKKMFGTANYYSNLANLYTKRHDYINNLAASEIMQENTASRDDTVLDLHTLYVTEALQALDLFLDKHIRKLRERDQKPYNIKLFFITGRGLHSPGKLARIKPAVKNRLLQRNVKFHEVNPGLLSGNITTQDILTDALCVKN